jgi:putative holliday junction resolvase
MSDKPANNSADDKEKPANTSSVQKPCKAVMAFDYGLRNIGVAVGNVVLGTSQGVGVLKARDGKPDWQEVERYLKEWQPDLVVVGNPLNMDGSESDMSLRAQKFSRQIHGRFGIAVDMMDERLSSQEAKSEARARGHRGDYNEAPIDADAAEIILRSYLNR